MTRFGMGYDVHRLTEGRKLILGGVEIPWEKGLLGHSDADVLLHAIADALLGAAALGDIGRHFPDTDEQFKGADSMKLLAEVVRLLREKGYRVGNVDATVVAQAPKLAPHIGTMTENIAKVLGVDIDCVNVKATTEERLGFTGSGEGYSPCTARACLELLDHYGIALSGKHAVIIGRSLVVSRPLAMLLLSRDATVTVCHTKTRDLPALCRTADMLVSAAGKAGLVDASFLRPGQVIVDVGVNVNADGRLCGDVRFEQAEPLAEAITPVPGGVGSVTTMVLCKHVIRAAEQASGQITPE